MILTQPEFYDIFGLFVFAFITVTAIWALKTKRALPVWVLVTLLIIGILGLIVDGTIVFTRFLA